MNKTYLFYDLETTGRNKCFDQVLQFAAIRTDLNLNELERYESRIKLNCDVIPEPEAILIHRIAIEQMLSGNAEGIEMANIHAMLNTPGTISGGYNTLGFDDEFLRFSFYRNLLPPYTHQWQNECGRFDLLPITMLYFLYNEEESEKIVWPTIDEKPSLKLENLKKANQLAPGKAHDAMVDVAATVALARRFFANKKMWDYAMGSFNKVIDATRTKQLPVAFNTSEKHYLALIIGVSGVNDKYQYPALFLGQHHHYKNQNLWLRLDQGNLILTTTKNIAENTWVCRRKAGEGGIILPYTSRFTRHLTEERRNITANNLQWLEANPEIFAQIKQYHQEYTYPKIPEADIETKLYDNGFLTREEDSLCHLFRNANIKQKIALFDQFTNLILQEIVIRFLGRNYFSELTSELQQEFKHYLSQLNPSQPELIPIDFRGRQRLTQKKALETIQKIRAEKILDPSEQMLLNELENYLTDTCHPCRKQGSR